MCVYGLLAKQLITGKNSLQIVLNAGQFGFLFNFDFKNSMHETAHEQRKLTEMCVIAFKLNVSHVWS